MEGVLGLLLLLGVCACDDPLAHLKIGKPVEKEDSGKSSGGQKRKVPEMGACQVIGVKVEELSGLCMTKDSTALWAVGDEGALCRTIPTAPSRAGSGSCTPRWCSSAGVSRPSS